MNPIVLELSPTVLFLSVAFILINYALIAWACWLAYRGMVAKMPAFHEGGHRPGAVGTYDPHYHPEAHPEVPTRGAPTAA